MSKFHDNKNKVIPIRRGIQKQKSETPHLDLARRILASAEPAVKCGCTELFDRLAISMQELVQQVQRLNLLVTQPYKKHSRRVIFEALRHI